MSGYEHLDVDALDGRARYQLLTSIVVPRPIGWVSTYSASGVPNLAPFSYYSALAATPMLIGVSVGHRRDGPKDTLQNVLDRQAFCTNLVGQPQLEAMNQTSGDYAPDVDEFEAVGLEKARALFVDAPFVADAPVIMECELFREVGLGDAPNTLVIGRVVHLHIRSDLPFVDGTHYLQTEALAPVGRLWGPTYTSLGDVTSIPRPRV